MRSLINKRGVRPRDNNTNRFYNRHVVSQRVNVESIELCSRSLNTTTHYHSINFASDISKSEDYHYYCHYNLSEYSFVLRGACERSGPKIGWSERSVEVRGRKRWSGSGAWNGRSRSGNGAGSGLSGLSGLFNMILQSQCHVLEQLLPPVLPQNITLENGCILDIFQTAVLI